MSKKIKFEFLNKLSSKLKEKFSKTKEEIHDDFDEEFSGELDEGSQRELSEGLQYDNSEDDVEYEFAQKPSLKDKWSSFTSRFKKDSDSDQEATLTDHEIPSISTSKGTKKKERSEFSLNEAITAFFSVERRQIIHKVFLIALVSIGSYFIGKTAANLIQGQIKIKKVKHRQIAGPSKRLNFRKEIADIKRSNLFNAKESGKKVKKPKKEEPKKINLAEIKCDSAERKSSLPIKLKNTIVLQDEVKSIASVQFRGKKDLLDIRKGEKIDDVAEISLIKRFEVILKNLKTGECEYVTNAKKEKKKKKKFKVLPASEGQKLLTKNTEIKNIGNKFKIKKSYRDKVLGNISQILSQARAIQIKNPDGTYSFKMTDITPGSLYSSLNIQDGDTIHKINGKEFTNLNQIMQELGRLKSTDKYEITLTRGGEEKVQEYEFH